MSTSGGSGGGGGIQVATVELDAAELATLNSAPTALVDAPGAGRLLVLVDVWFAFVPGVDGFTVDLQPFIRYTDAAGAPAHAMTGPIPADPYPAIAQAGVDVGSTFDFTTLANAPFVVTTDSDPERAGPIVTSALGDGGAAYVVGDTGAIDMDAYDGGAAYVVDTVAPVTGAVLTYHLTAAGNGYGTPGNPHPTTVGGAQPGIGTGLTINVLTIPPADGTLAVTLLYKVLPVT